MSGAAAANPDQMQQGPAPATDTSGYESAMNPQPSGVVQTPANAMEANHAAQGPVPMAATGGADKNAPETQTPGSTGNVAQQPAEPPPPVVLTPLKPTGIKGMMQSMMDAMAGTTRPELAKGSDGQMYVKETTLTHGEQWRKIIGNAVVGAAAGLAAGKGAGNAVKAPLAGVEAQQAQHKQEQDERAQMSDEAQKQNIQNANHQKLQMDIADHTWDAAQKKIKASEDMVKFAREGDKDLEAHGYKYIGMSPHPGDLSEILKGDPNVVENWIKNKTIEIRPMYNDDGTVMGWGAWRTEQDPRSVVLEPGYKYNFWNPAKNEMEVHTSTAPGTLLDQQTYNLAATNQQMDYLKQKGAVDKDEAEAQEKNDKHSQLPLENKKIQAETNRDNAEAGRASAEAANARALARGAEASQQPLSVWSPQQQQAVAGLANYTVNPASFPTRTQAKTGQMDRETAIGYARQIDPSYDEKEYNSRSKLQSDFRSGKSAQNIRSLNTAIDHLDSMASSGNALHNTNSQGANWVKNTMAPWFGATAPGKFRKDVNAVAGELSQLFKGTGATDTEIESWKKDMSEAQTPAQIRTGINEALRLMGGRYDALENQYTTGMGRPRDFQMLSPHSQKILSNLGATDLVQKDSSIPQRQPAAAPAGTHVFSPSAWAAANPGKDVNAAIAEAKRQGIPVSQ